MRRPRVVLLSALAALTVSGAWYWYRWQQEGVAGAIAEGVLQQLQTPHKVAVVDDQAWQRLRIGMSKQEVVQLLGEAPRRVGPTSVVGGQPSAAETLPEFWEYGFVAAFGTPVPDARSYVVLFASDGRVTAFRKPTVP